MSGQWGAPGGYGRPGSSGGPLPDGTGLPGHDGTGLPGHDGTGLPGHDGPGLPDPGAAGPGYGGPGHTGPPGAPPVPGGSRPPGQDQGGLLPGGPSSEDPGPHHPDVPGSRPGPVAAVAPGPGGPTAAGGGEPGTTPPPELRASRALWLVAAVLALLGALLNAATSRLADLPPATREALHDAAGPAADDPATMQMVFTAGMVLSAFVGILVCALTIWLTGRMLAGRSWARTLLDIRGIYLAVSAILMVLGLVVGDMQIPGNEIAVFAVAALQILAGLCAGVAVWRQHSGPANAFISPGRPGGDTRGAGAGRR